jgi:NAD(P)-dependent dehydrogenase (short-subunit alcohol dehydrogenase family)
LRSQAIPLDLFQAYFESDSGGNMSQGQQGKIAIVTGGSRGIGRSTVESLARRGVNVIFTYVSHREDALAVQAKTPGAQAFALQLDTGKVEAFEAFAASVRGVLAQLGAERFDYLVNNAGNSHRNMPLESVTEEEMDSIYRVHFKGVLFLTQKLLPLMNDGGRIVNVSTTRTRLSSRGGAAYAAMKGAVDVLSRHMATELGPRRITVNIIAPGAVATDFSGGIVRDNPEVNKLVASHTALGRVAGPDDIGPAIAALLADDNGWVNGQRIEVNGGVMM